MNRNNQVSLFEVLDSIFQPMDKRYNRENSVNITRGVPVNVEESEDHYLLTAELPGFKKDEVFVTFEDNLLTIKANKVVEKITESDEKQEDKNVKPKLLIKERSERSVSRSFELTKDIDQQNVQASFVDGLLSLKLNKKPEDKQVIKVEVL